MSLFTNEGLNHHTLTPTEEKQPSFGPVATTSTVDPLSAAEDGSKDKLPVDNSPFYNQFCEVEKAITNFTKHQPFNHHYAPNVNITNNSNNNSSNNNSNGRNHHHHNNNHNHYGNRGNNHNNHNHNHNYNHNNHNHNHNYNNSNHNYNHNYNNQNHNSHHNANNNNAHYNNNNNNGGPRLQPQTFTMNAQLKQQQQQQFLSSAAQQINNRYKSGGNLINGNLEQMVNVNNNSMDNGMAQVNNINAIAGMAQMTNTSGNLNGISGLVNNTIPNQTQQQTQGFMTSQYQAPPPSMINRHQQLNLHHQSQNQLQLQQHQQQQHHQQQPQSMVLGNAFIPPNEFDTFSQGQPQLSHSDFIAPFRNTSPQFSAPGRPVSVGGFSTLEQTNSNFSFGVSGNGGELQSPLTNPSPAIDNEYGEKNLPLGDSTYLGDIWGSGKGLRNSASVWA